MLKIENVAVSPEYDIAYDAAELLIREIYVGHTITTPESFLEGCRRFGTELFVGTFEDDPDQVIAAATVNHGGNNSFTSELRQLAVHPYFRRFGLGREMVEHVSLRSRALGNTALSFVPNYRTRHLSVPFFNKITGGQCLAGSGESVCLDTILNSMKL